MKQRVLVVDDYPETADAISKLLELLGHDARVATSGRAAIAEAVGYEPSVVILDIGLADISGFEVAETLRRSPHRQPYIAALTGWSHPQKRRRAIDVGCDDYVVKPADASTLRTILDAVERRQRPHQ